MYCCKLVAPLVFSLFAFLAEPGLLRADGPEQTDDEQPELLFFYNNDSELREQSAVVKHAMESGFRIREIAAKRFPRLAKRFQIRRFPALIMLRRNQIEERHEGRFGFPRIRQMFAKVRQRRLDRLENRHERLAARLQPGSRVTSPPALSPEYMRGPRYIQTATVREGQPDAHRANPSMIQTGLSGLRVPAPLDRSGRYPVARTATEAEAIAYNATVRLRVVDPSGTSHGTGTIIHSRGNESLVITCGHIFRESAGRGRIEADVLFGSRMTKVAGKLVGYDAKAHDIAVLVIRTPQAIRPVRIASRQDQHRLNQDVFTVGCDRGDEPSIRRSHFKRRAIYDGVEKYDVFGRPIDGRSGGGLFNKKGELIGVCNAMAVHVDEGIYSGLKTIYWQLQTAHLDQLFPAEGQQQPAIREYANTRMQPVNATRTGMSRSESTDRVTSPPSSSSAWKSVGSLKQSASEEFIQLPSLGASRTLDGNSRSIQPVNSQSRPADKVTIDLRQLPPDLAAQVRAASRIN